MNVSVEETRSNELALGVDDLCAFADAVCGVADKRDAAAGNRHVDVIEDLMRADVYETCIANDRLCGAFCPSQRQKACGSIPKAWSYKT